MRPISSVSWGANRLDIFSLGTDNALKHLSWGGPGTGWASQWESLGGVFTSAVTAVTRGVNLLDVFGLGTDYSMFHKSYSNGAWSANWESLGGNFVSSPAVVATSPTRIDVFGLGSDHGLYQRTWNNGSWSPGWVSLGGTFASQPEVVSSGPNRIDLFATYKDFSMYHIFWNGSAWAAWEPLGGTFVGHPAVALWQQPPLLKQVATEAVAAATPAIAPAVGTPTAAPVVAPLHVIGPIGPLQGTESLSVFGIGTDGSMYYRTWNGSAWQTADWVSLGGIFISPPTVISRGEGVLDVFGVGTDYAVYHKTLSNDSWSAEWVTRGGNFPSPVAVVARDSGHLDVFGIEQSNSVFQIFQNSWELSAAIADGVPDPGWGGFTQVTSGSFTIPGIYRLSLDSFSCENTRSLHNDTDYVSVTVTVGARPPQTITKSTGDIDSGSVGVDMAFEPVSVDLCEFVLFTYIILNNGHSEDSVVEADLTAAAGKLASAGASAVSKALGSALGAAIGLAAIGGILVPILGSALGALAGWLVGELTSIIFADCDGVVATEQAVLTGVQLRTQTLNGVVVAKQTTHSGSDSPVGCGANSLYKTFWSYQLADAKVQTAGRPSAAS